jgi:hypothetical protein
MKFIPGWQALLSLLILVGITAEVQSQKRRVEDKDWLDVPYLDMEVPDSVRSVKFYSGSTREILRHDEEPGNMKLTAELLFDRMGREEKLRFYREYDGRNYITYDYSYPNDSALTVSKKSFDRKEHEWFYEDSSLVKEISYKGNGKPKYIWHYEHLNDTILTRIEKQKANGKSIYTWSNSLDTISQELRLNKYVKEELVNSVVYSYDTLGFRLVGTFDYDGIKFLSSQLKVEQDSLIHIPVKELCAAHPSQTRQYDFELDSLNRIINKSCKTGVDGRIFDFTYSYNVLNQVAEIYSLGDAGNEPISIEVKYNENGDPVEKKFFQDPDSDKKQFAKLIWKYDEDGFLTKSLEVFNSGPYSYSSCEMIKYIKWVSLFE